MHGIGTITDSNTMFCYFEMIEKLGAKSILDAGMFLKRIGAVSRQMAGVEINAEAVLCGIDFYPEIHLPIFAEVYNEIRTEKDFIHCLDNDLECFACMKNNKFDLAVMLEAGQVLDELDQIKITEYFMQNVNGILADESIGKWMTGRGMIKGYYPICIESSRFAWIPVKELRS